MTLTEREKTIEQVLEIFKIDIHRKSSETVNYYIPVARKYLLATNGDFTRAAMLNYFDTAGYCDNSLRTIYRVLERLCKSLDIKFPLDSGDLPPPVDEEDINTPIMSPTNVQLLIQYWRGYPDEYVTSLVFLSTIYGLRATEMTDLEIGSGLIQYNVPMSITVDVAKRKRKVTRVHLLPSGYELFLHGYHQNNDTDVKLAFNHAIKYANIKKDGSWHSIRRSLFTSFINTGAPKELIKRYMRWAKDKSDMGSVYYNADFNQVNKVVFSIESMPFTNPPQFIKHPFLKFWG